VDGAQQLVVLPFFTDSLGRLPEWMRPAGAVPPESRSIGLAKTVR
jgi:hypothetical protein